MATTTTKKTEPREPEVSAHVGGDSAGYIAFDVHDDAPDGVWLPFPRPFNANAGSGDVLVVTPTGPLSASVPFYVGVDRGPTDYFHICLTGAVTTGTYSYAYHLRPAG